VPNFLYPPLWSSSLVPALHSRFVRSRAIAVAGHCGERQPHTSAISTTASRSYEVVPRIESRVRQIRRQLIAAFPRTIMAHAEGRDLSGRRSLQDVRHQGIDFLAMEYLTLVGLASPGPARAVVHGCPESFGTCGYLPPCADCFRFPVIQTQSRRRLVSRICSCGVAPSANRMPPRGAAGVAWIRRHPICFLSQLSRSRSQPCKRPAINPKSPVPKIR
jgi:hypothetical protein